MISQDRQEVVASQDAVIFPGTTIQQ